MTLNLTGAGLARQPRVRRDRRRRGRRRRRRGGVRRRRDRRDAPARGRPPGRVARHQPGGVDGLIDRAHVVARDRDRGADRRGDRRRAAGGARPRRRRSRWPGRGRRDSGRRLHEAGGGGRDGAGRGARRRSTPRSWSPTGARSTSARPTSRPRRSTATASSACGWTTPRPRPARRRDRRRRRRPRHLARRRYIARGMADDRNPPSPPDPTDRKAYLEEQIQRQKRGEPIDVEWVTEELQRVRREQVAPHAVDAAQPALAGDRRGASCMSSSGRATAAALDRGGFVTLGLIVIGLFAALVLAAGASLSARRPRAHRLSIRSSASRRSPSSTSRA